MHVILATVSSPSVTISSDDILLLATLMGAVISIFAIIFTIYRWYLRQNAQDVDIADTKEEMQLLTYGMLACLEGLKQLNCNGPVTDARDKISKHLNEKAHR